MRLIASLIAILCLVAMPARAGDDALEQMLAADKAFAAMADAEGAPAAFAAYAAEDVRMFPEGGLPYDGRDALIARFASWPDGATLAWTPQGGASAPAGDFGYTWGLSTFTVRNDDGEETVQHGKYISIWRREAGGAWKFVADMGNAAPASADN